MIVYVYASTGYEIDIPELSAYPVDPSDEEMEEINDKIRETFWKKFHDKNLTPAYIEEIEEILVD